jgi:predicted CXXCH cytochrome family protein
MVIPANALGGVDCSTCHHEALPHGMERKDITRKTKVSPKLCLNCHTKERSPDYDEEMYFPMVTHGK